MVESTIRVGGEVQTRRHLPALDGVRGLAMFAVLVFHLHGHLLFRVQKGHFPVQAPLSALFTISGYGMMGVDLFFVLSGFLITGILADARLSPSYYGAFYARRALRIFPLYFGFLLLCLVIVPTFSTLPTTGFASAVSHQSYLWSYCSNLGMVFNRINFGPLNHFWSLAVEEQFYLIWPLIVLLSPPDRLGRVCLVCVVIAVAARIALRRIGLPDGAYMLMPSRLDEFGIGGLLAVAERHGSIKAARYRVGLWLIVSAVSLGLALAVMYAFRVAPNVEFSLCYLAVATASAALIWLAVASRQHLLRRFLMFRPLRALGKYSYGVYVLHVPLIPILYAVWQRFLNAARVAPSAPVLVASFDVFAAVTIVLVAMASFHLFEKRFLKLKRRFDYAVLPNSPAEAQSPVLED